MALFIKNYSVKLIDNFEKEIKILKRFVNSDNKRLKNEIDYGNEELKPVNIHR